MSLPHSLKGITFMLLLFAIITAAFFNTPVTGFVRDMQESMVNDVTSVSTEQNLVVPVYGEVGGTTGIMAFFSFIKLIFDTALMAFGLLSVFYQIINIFPSQILGYIVVFGSLFIVFAIIAYTSNLGRE